MGKLERNSQQGVKHTFGVGGNPKRGIKQPFGKFRKSKRVVKHTFGVSGNPKREVGQAFGSNRQ